MSEYAVGQRWISQTESQLGLGLITEVSHRRVTLSFPAANESRTYSADNPPISRIQYLPEDTIKNHDERPFTVARVLDNQPIVQYLALDEQGNEHQISEIELSCFIQFSSPLQRLLSSHIDRNRAFRLRVETLEHKHRLQQSQIKGLLGARTHLLPHQLYIADQVAKRSAPRVLLADEVGLGKTIEAGLILHAQLHNGFANRVLIIVPTSLKHQWLVEMLRKFNLQFALFSQERYDALVEEGIENPFETEQLVLCDLALLMANDSIQQNALNSDWDLVIVDEAHHLHWSGHGSEQHASPEYTCIEQLAARSSGLLLLTATPEQAGRAGHFARLRLIDPDKFHSLEHFIKQEKNLTDISALLGELIQAEDSEPLPGELIDRLAPFLSEHASQSEHGSLDFTQPAGELKPTIQADIIDRHGTGRVFFRNTRHSIEGFPPRVLHPHPLTGDEATSLEDLDLDPRTQWLVEFLKSNPDEKTLVIGASAELAVDLDEYLKLTQGIASTSFHEGLSIIERDRAAAYFADRESGSQTLICSEIGSEGRNFQFAKHLVLFDLPSNPDLLEQRIGRLDRIGRQRDVHIHVPYLLNSDMEGLFHWYHQGLNAFLQSCSAGYALFQQFETQLQDFLHNKVFPSNNSNSDNTNSDNTYSDNAFLSSVRSARDAMMAELEEGRNYLLELNSCNPQQAETLIEQIELEEECQLLSSYMERVFNLYGVEQEFQSDQTLIIRPSDKMLQAEFPSLKPEGNTLTFQRLKALVREDIDFVTWEHPMVVDFIDQYLSGEFGNAALAKLSLKNIPAGTLFLEAIFTVNSMAPRSLQLDRFLPISPLRILVDVSGKNLAQVLSHDQLNQLCSGIKRTMRHAIMKEIRPNITTLFEHAQALAEQALPEQLSAAQSQWSQHLEAEITRLQDLQLSNPLIKDAEIQQLKDRQQQGLNAIEHAHTKVEAMRIIINS